MLILNILSLYRHIGGREEEFLPINEDSPIQFTGENFVRSLVAKSEIIKTTYYIERV